MDIYEYINSKDIRTYLKETNYKFNSLESAYLVWQSRRHTIKEKHRAYCEIVSSMPNIKFYMRDWDRSPSELFQFLSKYISVENELIKTFDTDEEAVFSYARDCCYTPELYPDKEMCLEAIKCFEGCDSAEQYMLIYRPIVKRIGEKASSITQYINREGECVFVSEDSFFKGEKCKIFNTFKLLHFGVPLPFKKGDKLIEQYNAAKKAFLFDPQNSEFSNKDMSMWCYLPEQRADMCVDNYLNLEYYNEEYDEVMYNWDDCDDFPF